jgi:Tol biopolymer transport system component
MQSSTKPISISVRLYLLIIAFLLPGCLPDNNKVIDTKSTLLPFTDSAVPEGISGWVVYSAITDNKTYEKNIFLKNLDTDEIVQLTKSGNNSEPKWSPDGEKILYLTWTDENQYDINIMDKAGNNRKELLSTVANERMANWSPDGKNIVFVSDSDGGDDIYVMNLETMDITQLTNFPGKKLFPSWSSDGYQIAFVSSEKVDRLQIFSMDINGENVQQLTAFNLDNFDKEPVWCPDDSCIIFTRLAGPAKLMFLDLNTMNVSYLLNDAFKTDENIQPDEGRPSLSPVRGYLTFSVRGMFYAMNLNTKEIFPLNIQALDLSLYP